MGRILKLLAIGLGGLFALLLLAVFVLPKTGPGRALIDGIARPVVEEAVKAQLGSDIDFAPLKGALPGELILEDVALRHDGEVWVSADRLTLRWSPLALLRREIRVEDLLGENVVLHRTPDLPARAEDDASEPTAGFSLPDAVLGNLRISPFSIREPVLGERYDITVTLEGETNDRRVRANGAVATLQDSDAIDLRVDFDGQTLSLATELRSVADGFIARAANADGPVSLSLEGEGPLEEWSGELDLSAGEYGTVIGILGGNLDALTSAHLAVVASPGPLLPETARQVTGRDLNIVVDTARAEDGALTITLNEVSGDFGALTGTVATADGRFEEVTADLRADLEQDVLALFGAEVLAGTVEVEGEARLGDGTAEGAADITTPLGTVSLTNAMRGEDGTLSADIAAAIDDAPAVDPRLDPLLAAGVDAAASLRVEESGTVRVRDFRMVTREPDATRIGVEGALVLRRGAPTSLETDLTTRLGADAVAALMSPVTLEGPVTITTDISGPVDALALIASAELPAGAVDGTAFPAGDLSADLAGLPSAPTGVVRLTSRTGSYDGTVRMISEGDEITLPQLAFRGGTLTLDGRGVVNRATGAAEADITLDAPQPTTLITGQTVEGTLTATASVGGGQDGPVDATAALSQFTFGGITVGRAQARVDGTMDALSFDLTGRNAALPGVFLAALETRGTAAFGVESPEVMIAALSAALDEDREDRRITLASPTTVGLGDTITLADTRFDWLSNGTLALRGSYGADRWIAEITGADVALPGAPLPISADISLDTDRETPARFSLSAQAAPPDDTMYTAKLDGRWSGTALTMDLAVRDEDGSDPLATSQLSVPLTLLRGDDGLSVSVPEGAPLDGVVRVDTALEPFYAFLPTVPPYLTGLLDARLDIGGTPTAPTVSGSASLSEGRFEEATVGLTLTDLSGTLDVRTAGGVSDLRIDMTGADSRGRDEAVSLSGTARLEDGTPQVDLTLTLDDAAIIDGPQMELTTDADLSLTGSGGSLLAAGSIDILSARAGIPELPEGAPSYVDVEVVRVDQPANADAASTEEDTSGAGQSGPDIRLDIAVTAPDEIVVEGRGLESEWQADLDIGGTATEPRIDGRVEIIEGTFEFAGRTFDFTEGRAIFGGADPTSAALDVRAAYDTGDITAFVDVGGTIGSPSISLSSNPARPDEDVLALVLFGKQPTELSALESLQIANALRQLTGVGPSLGGGGGNPLQDALGLDALSVGLDSETGEGVIELGKNVTEKIYVGARQTASGTGSEVTVTYDVTDTITIESTLEPNGQQSVSANFKRDY